MPEMKYGKIEDLYSMKPFEKYTTETKDTFIRVPGGWVYRTNVGCCFVPYDNEFM